MVTAEPRRAAKNIASVDVEDYFHVESFTGVVKRDDWDRFPLRVEANTRRLLDLFDEVGIRGTFFILGWVAERFPGLVREIVARGHEPACHSYWHRLIYKLTPEEFREDTRRAKGLIEQAGGVEVTGYRAPSFSVTRASAWAAGVLLECGIRYDSSIFPVRHDVYGIPDAPRRPFWIETSSGRLLEYPMTTFRIGARGPNLPVAGGGYLRLFPFRYTEMGVRRARREGLPVILYIHPWEVDPDQPRLKAGWKSRIRHYTNLAKTADRLIRLLRMGEFTTFRDSGWSGKSDLDSVPL